MLNTQCHIKIKTVTENVSSLSSFTFTLSREGGGHGTCAWCVSQNMSAFRLVKLMP